MLLAIDIGNTNTKFGIFDNNSLIARFTIPTVRNHTAAEIFNQTKFKNIDGIIVASVVPELENAYREFSDKHFNLSPVFVDNTFNFDLKINYRPPESLGVDRIVNAFAAAKKYGAPCVVCSFGTATTIDVVSRDGEFLGGTITPGMNAMSEALFLKTARLPKVEIEKPASVIGDSTTKSIQAGIYFGGVGAVETIIEKIFSELGENMKVVATGGFARIIAEGSPKIEIVEEDLLLEGLRLIYQNHFRSA